MIWLMANFLAEYYWFNRAIGITSRVFANSPGDMGSILGRVIPKIQ